MVDSVGKRRQYLECHQGRRRGEEKEGLADLLDENSVLYHHAKSLIPEPCSLGTVPVVSLWQSAVGQETGCRDEG